MGNIRLSINLCFSVAIVISFANSGCQNDIKEIRAITDPRVLPLQTSINAEYRLSEKGKRKNILKAAQLDQYQGDENYIVASGGYEITFYDSLEVQDAKLTATNGRYSENSKTMIATGNVVLSNREGAKLETEEIVFQLDSARIYTDKFVIITTENGSVLRGKGLESNDSFTRYKILEPTGDLYLNENPEQ